MVEVMASRFWRELIQKGPTPQDWSSSALFAGGWLQSRKTKQSSISENPDFSVPHSGQTQSSGNASKGDSCSYVVIRISFSRIVNVTSHITYIFLH